MPRPFALASILLFLLVASCDEEESRGAEEGERCAATEDCRVGLSCVDDVCEDVPECEIDHAPCGSLCCRPDQLCVEGTCELNCTSGIECGEVCCTEDEACLEGVCCGPGRVCGSSCCSGEEECIDEVCITCPRPICGGTECCADDHVCVADACCPMVSACGETCCAEDEVCEAESCVPGG